MITETLVCNVGYFVAANGTAITSLTRVAAPTAWLVFVAENGNATFASGDNINVLSIGITCARLTPMSKISGYCRADFPLEISIDYSTVHTVVYQTRVPFAPYEMAMDAHVDAPVIAPGYGGFSLNARIDPNYDIVAPTADLPAMYNGQNFYFNIFAKIQHNTALTT